MSDLPLFSAPLDPDWLVRPTSVIECQGVIRTQPTFPGFSRV